MNDDDDDDEDDDGVDDLDNMGKVSPVVIETPFKSISHTSYLSLLACVTIKSYQLVKCQTPQNCQI